MMNDNKRISYSITLRAYPSERNKLELINYLKSLDRGQATKKVEDLLLAALLSLAKQHSGQYTAEQLRLSCLENCNALAHHSSYLKQAVIVTGLAHVNISEFVTGNKCDQIEGLEELEELDEIQNNPIPSTLAEDGNISDVLEMFG